MIRHSTLLALAFALATGANAQERCTSRSITERWLQARGEHVDLATEAAAWEQLGQERGGGPRTIPVVVHVVWNTNAENVSDNVINNVIAEMNADYQALNSDYGNVRPGFLSSRGNPQITFCLATVDPNGDPTTGITRQQTSRTWFDPDTDTDDMKFAPVGTPAWNSTQYLNIWICDISSGATGGFVTLGYAYLPVGNMPGSNVDGLVLDYNYGTSPGSRTATHEIGHYLGLDHPWGNGNCNPGDGISDTPATNSPTYTCSNPNLIKCGTLTQYENFMDYSNCPVMFTNGQVNVMNGVLNGVRASLLSSPGCNGPATGPCIPTSANGTADGDFIDGVVLGSINNTGSGSSSGPTYVNNMGMSASLDRGASYSVAITSGSYAQDHYAAWIDYNGDNVFAAAEKLGEFASNSAFSTQNISFTVPMGATLGTTRMRVRGVYHLESEPSPTDPCFNYAYGETEDYGILITGGGGSPCIPTSATGTADGDFVDGVTLDGDNGNDIMNTGTGSTSGPTYQAYMGHSATLTRNGNYTVTVTTGEYYQDIVGAWIDFNSDNTFSASEKVGETISSTAFQNIPFNFTVPGNATLGNTVMRVRVVFPDTEAGEPETAEPCINYSWGETEDYSIVITTATAIGEENPGGLSLQNGPEQVLVTWHAADQGGQVLVMDASGRTVFTQEAGSNQLAIRTTELAPGLYHVLVILRGERFSARFAVGSH